MLFIRSWLGLYIALLIVGVIARMKMPYIEEVGVLILNIFTLLVTLGGWLLFEKKLKLGFVILKSLSVIKLLVITMNASIIFSFVIAYIPTGPAWSEILKLPTPLYFLISALFLVGEIYFFRTINQMFKPVTK